MNLPKLNSKQNEIWERVRMVTQIKESLIAIAIVLVEALEAKSNVSKKCWLIGVVAEQFRPNDMRANLTQSEREIRQTRNYCVDAIESKIEADSTPQ